MTVSIPALAGIALLVPVCAFAAEPDSLLIARADHALELFRWAEYDSLLETAPALASDTALPAGVRSQLRLAMGAALFTEGWVAASGAEFEAARRLDSAESLDPLYVEKDVVQHYRLTLASSDYMRSYRAAEARRTASALRREAGRASVLGWLGLASGAVAAGLAAYEYSKGDAAYQEMLHAARVTGNDSQFRKKRSAVRAADRRTVSAGVIGLTALLAGGIMHAESWELRRQGWHARLSASSEAENMEVSWAF